jgi:HSP20 family protein
MANLTVRRAEPIPAPREYDPFKMMRELIRWDPYSEMVPSFASEPTMFQPAFEVKETKEGFLFKADLPGVKESDVEISLTGNRLTIGGKRETEKTEKTDTFYAFERAYGSFSRSFTLPEGADLEHVKAELREGVLTVQLTKLPEAQTKKIALRPAEKGKA